MPFQKILLALSLVSGLTFPLIATAQKPTLPAKPLACQAVAGQELSYKLQEGTDYVWKTKPAGPLAYRLIAGSPWLHVANDGKIFGTPPIAARGASWAIIEIQGTQGERYEHALRVQVIQPPLNVGTEFKISLSKLYPLNQEFRLMAFPKWMNLVEEENETFLVGTPEAPTEPQTETREARPFEIKVELLATNKHEPHEQKELTAKLMVDVAKPKP